MVLCEVHEVKPGMMAAFWVLRCRRCGAGVGVSVYAGKTSGHARRNLVRSARRRGWDTANGLCPLCVCLPTSETHTPICLPGGKAEQGVCHQSRQAGT